MGGKKLKMEKTYQIRYNTHSNGVSDAWRLICGKEEILVSDIVINSKTFTTKDYMEELQEFKWHISCKGVLTIKEGNIAYIDSKRAIGSVKRHILKTISYRVLATSFTVVGSLLVGASLQMSVMFGIGELLFKPVLYFLHERLWLRVKIKG